MVSLLLAICALALATRWVAYAAAAVGIPPTVSAVITTLI